MDTATVIGGSRVLRVVGIAAGIGVAVLADHIGWWWVTPALGVAIGVFARRWWVPLWCVVAGLLIWGGDLAVQASGGGIGRVATVSGALIGLGPDAGSTVVAVTVVFGVLLCLAGGWLGAAVRSLLRQIRPPQPPAGTAAAADAPASAPVDTPVEAPVPALALTANVNLDSKPKERLSHG